MVDSFWYNAAKTIVGSSLWLDLPVSTEAMTFTIAQSNRAQPWYFLALAITTLLFA